MSRTQFAAAAALLAGASLITAPGAQAAPGDAVVYTVTSDAPLAAISYSDATGTTQVLPNQAAPWTLSFTSKDTSATPMLALTAIPTGQQTTCTISVNGTVKDTQSKTGTGEKAQVICGAM
jgi:Mycobacterium membrane protein